MIDVNSFMTIEVEVSSIGRIRFNRPEKRNALSPLMMKEIAQALIFLDSNPEVRVIVLSGNGKGFCAGAELDSMSGSIEQSVVRKKNLVDLLETLTKIETVTIASVHGFALAGGMGVVGACDMSVVTDDTKLGVPEINRGIFPMTIMANLNKVLPQKLLLELMFTGRLLGPEEAKQVGFVNYVVNQDELESKTLELANTISKKSKVALGMGKNAFYTMRDMEYYTAMNYLISMLTIVSSTEDAAEGINAFLEKREAVWK